MSKFYAGIHQRLPEPQIYQDLPIDVAGKHLLLFDDVADSGGSLKFVSDLLAERNAASVTMATLFYKRILVSEARFLCRYKPMLGLFSV